MSLCGAAPFAAGEPDYLRRVVDGIIPVDDFHLAADGAVTVRRSDGCLLRICFEDGQARCRLDEIGDIRRSTWLSCPGLIAPAIFAWYDNSPPGAWRQGITEEVIDESRPIERRHVTEHEATARARLMAASPGNVADFSLWLDEEEPYNHFEVWPAEDGLLFVSATALHSGVWGYTASLPDLSLAIRHWASGSVRWLQLLSWGCPDHSMEVLERNEDVGCALRQLRGEEPPPPYEPSPELEAAAKRMHEEVRRLVDSVRAGVAPIPEGRLIREPYDAELVAAEWMRYWGYLDAVVTGRGTDNGIDVKSKRAVAQVKTFMVPIGRPALQNLHGVAQAAGCPGIFFALTGYTQTAVAWADSVNMALFRFDYQGKPEPVNDAALNIVDPSRPPNGQLPTA